MNAVSGSTASGLVGFFAFGVTGVRVAAAVDDDVVIVVGETPHGFHTHPPAFFVEL